MRALVVVLGLLVASSAAAKDTIRVHPADGSLAPANTTVVIEWRGAWGPDAPSITLRQLVDDGASATIPADIVVGPNLVWLRPRVRLRAGAQYAIDAESDATSYTEGLDLQHPRLAVFTATDARDDTPPSAPRIVAAYRFHDWAPWQVRLWLWPAVCASPSVLYGAWRGARGGRAPDLVVRPVGARLALDTSGICDPRARCELSIAPIDLAGNVGDVERVVLDPSTPYEPVIAWDDWNRGAILCDTAAWYGVVPERPETLPPPRVRAPQARRPEPARWPLVGAAAAFALAALAFAWHRRHRRRAGAIL